MPPPEAERWASPSNSDPRPPASRKNIEYSDQPVAATIPSETNVSIVVVRWRALRTAAW